MYATRSGNCSMTTRLQQKYHYCPLIKLSVNNIIQSDLNKCNVECLSHLDSVLGSRSFSIECQAVDLGCS